MPLQQTVRSLQTASLLAVVAILGCGGSGGGDSQAARAPAKAGDVWEIDKADDRAGAPAALLAYVSGVHLMVLDGNDAFAGMTRLTAQSKPGGGRMLQLSPSLDAELVSTPEGMELRFSTGETVPMRRKTSGRSAQ